MKTLALIPARSGSKRIKNKNIKLFCGEPIINYSIRTAIASNIFSEVMVSTDSNEIAQIAEKCGAQVPFLRTSKTSDDNSGILAVISEVVEMYKQRNVEFESICCILPTAPLLQKEYIIEGAKRFFNGKYDSLISVGRFNYPIQRALIVENNQIKMLYPENYHFRSQDLDPTFHDAGQFYFLNHTECFKKGRIFTDNSIGFELPEIIVQDIDNLTDWEICEFKFKYLQNKVKNSL